MKTICLCTILISVCFGMDPTEIGKAIRKGGTSIEKRIDKIEEYHAVYGLMEIHIKIVNGKITEGKIKRYCGSDRTGYDDMILDISFARLLIDKIFEPKECEPKECDPCGSENLWDHVSKKYGGQK